MEKHPEAKSGTFLIRQALIVDPGSSHHNRKADIFIENGIITQIGDLNIANAQVIDAENCIAMPGLFDLRCRQGEPGLEQNETIESLINAATQGGFTGLAVLPDTQPPVQSRSQIEFILGKSRNKSVSVYPLGATTQNLEGKDLAELYDMQLGGAIGFSNADHAYSAGSLQRALLYSRSFNGLIFSHAEDLSLSNGGYVNESNNTAALGLKPLPAHAEFTAIATQIEIARYTNSRLHFSHISTSESVNLIRKAKSEGIAITCDVSILHLILNDTAVLEFDANLKLMPPLRNETDRLALIAGLNDGTIDCIVSDHNPQAPEHKVVEFNYAPFGASTIQLFTSLYFTYLKTVINLETFYKSTVLNPRKILGLVQPQIEVGQVAGLFIFNPNSTWTFNRATNASLSYNSHLFGTEIKGKTTFLIHQNQIFINS